MGFGVGRVAVGDWDLGGGRGWRREKQIGRVRSLDPSFSCKLEMIKTQWFKPDDAFDKFPEPTNSMSQ